MKDCEIVERVPKSGELAELRKLVDWGVPSEKTE